MSFGTPCYRKTGLARADNKRPHLDQCINCTNTKPTTGLVTGIDAGPSLMYCQCNPGNGAAQANWPTAVFDLGESRPRA
jgi:hypothetical protein